jgi:PD-(D/E)XK nuclease superfamily
MLIEPQINADERRIAINEIASRIIGAAYAVSNQLGVGFLEKVYEKALTQPQSNQTIALPVAKLRPASR